MTLRIIATKREGRAKKEKENCPDVEMPGPPGKNTVGIITEYREGRVVPMRRFLENDNTPGPANDGAHHSSKREGPG